MVILIPTIKISNETMSRLEKHGKFQDTWDRIIERLLDEKEEREKKEAI